MDVSNASAMSTHEKDIAMHGDLGQAEGLLGKKKASAKKS